MSGDEPFIRLAFHVPVADAVIGRHARAYATGAIQRLHRMHDLPGLAAESTGVHRQRPADSAGIPGTIGGALAMNAGAFGGETWKIVHAVETLDRAGSVRTRMPADYRIRYRHVEGQPDEWFVAGHFRLAKGEASKAK